MNASSLHRRRGEFQKSQQLAQIALDLWHGVEDLWGEASARTFLARLYIDTQKFDAATDCTLRALKIRRELGNVTQVAGLLESAARVLRELGKPDSAAVVLTAAATHRTRSAARPWPDESLLANEENRCLRELLGHSFETSRDRGRHMNVAETIEFAISAIESRS